MYNLTPADLEIQARARALVDELIPYEEDAEAHGGELPDPVVERFRERTLAVGLHATNMPKELGGWRILDAPTGPGAGTGGTGHQRPRLVARHPSVMVPAGGHTRAN